MSFAGHVAHRFLREENPEGKRSLGKPRHRWEFNIKIDVKGIICETLEWFVCLRIETSGYLL